MRPDGFLRTYIRDDGETSGWHQVGGGITQCRAVGIDIKPLDCVGLVAGHKRALLDRHEDIEITLCCRGIGQRQRLVTTGRWDTTSGDNEVHYTNVVLGVSRYNLDGQLKFTWHELTDIGYGYSALKNTTTVKEATDVFASKFEICGDCNNAAREQYASDAYNRYK